MKWFYRDRGYFEAKSKSSDAIIKRAAKEYPLELIYMLRNLRIGSKEFKRNEFMQ